MKDDLLLMDIQPTGLSSIYFFPQDILCAQPNGGKNVLRADGCVPFNGQRLSVEFPWCCIVSLRPEMSPIYVLHRCCLTH